MTSIFKAISLSHLKAPISIREKFHLTQEGAASLSDQLSQILGLEEFMVLSTCNRTEVYYQSENELAGEIIRLLCLEKGLADFEKFEKYFDSILEPETAEQHLFEVSMGLQSGVVGDLQISNQVKNAYAMSSDMKFAGPFLHRLMHTIFHANKRVQQETAFRDGAASVSYASAELANELVIYHRSPSVLVIGMGEMGRDVVRNLKNSRFQKVALMNRTIERANEMALESNGEVIPFEDLHQVITQFDVVISTVSSSEPIIRPEHFLQNGDFHNKFFIDLSVPRSIDPRIEQIPGIVHFSIDEIRKKTDSVLEQRLAAVPKVRKIIEEELHGFRQWSDELSISPTIQKLKEALDRIRQDEMARYLKHASDEEAKLLEKASKSMMNKILKLPVLQLKAACKRGEQETLIGVLNDLFNLEASRETQSSKDRA